MNLIIDVGNTRIKLAVFKEDTLLKTSVSSYNDINKNIRKLVSKYTLSNCIVSSVGKANLIDKGLFSDFEKVTYLNHKTPIPFKNKYESPKTLGVDRIALISAAAAKYPNENVLVIDAGTCVTYDIINSKNQYLGGAISPGINIRYKSLNEYTANLPLLEISTFSLIGKSTNQSIQSGVLNGITREIDGVIDQYCQKYSTLTVVLTGGDANFLAKKLKSSIFAIPNFLLEGLNSILIHNIDG